MSSTQRDTLTSAILACFVLAHGACMHNPAASGTGGFHYPGPTGEFPIGTRYLFLKDLDRLDAYSGNPGDHRWLSAKMWYPAAPLPGSQPALFGDDEFNRSMVEAEFFDSSFLAEVEKGSIRIEDRPRIGPFWTYSKVPDGVRRLSLQTFPYHLVYVDDPRLVIVAVAHMKRHPDYWLSRLCQL